MNVKCVLKGCRSALLVGFLGFSAQVMASQIEEKVSKCLDQYESLYAKFGNENVNSLYSEWVGLASECSQTGAYEYLLGKLLIAKQDFIGAIEILKHAKDANFPSHKDEILFNLANAYFFVDNYKLAEQEYEGLIEFRPEWWEARRNLGLTLVWSGKYKEGVFHLKHAAAHEPSYEAFRGLIIANYYLGEYALATEYFNEAYTVNEGLFSDKLIMLPLSISYAHLGKFEHSQRVLAQLLKTDGALIDDDEFLKAGYEVKRLYGVSVQNISE